MPLTPEKVGKAKELENKLQMKLNSMIESSGFNDKDPEFVRTRSNLDQLRLSLKEFDDSNTKKDTSGKLTEDAPNYSGQHYIEGEGTPNFAYEPPVDVVKNFLKNPENISKLGLQSWAGDDQIESITDQSTAYRVVADHFWNQNVKRAKAKNMPLYRYSKLSFGEDPGKVITGGLLKHIPAFFLGADETMSLGAVQKTLGKGAEIASGEPIRAEQEEQKEYVSPGAATAGRIGGYLTPMGVGGQAARLGSHLVSGIKSLGGKALASAGFGAATSAAEGAGQDVVKSVSDGTELDTEQLLDDSAGRAIFGAVGGGVGELLGAGAKEIAESIRVNNPRFQDIRDLENAGGRISVNPFKPVQAPDVVQENLRRSLDNRGITSPVEAAAEKVAPKIADSIETQARETERAAGEALEKYHSSPQGLSPKRVTGPAKTMIDMLRKGMNIGDLGTTVDVVPQIAKNIRKRLQNITERKNVTSDEAIRLKQKYGDDIIIMNVDEADSLVGPAEIKHDVARAQASKSQAYSPDEVAPNSGKYDPVFVAKVVNENGGLSNSVYMKSGMADMTHAMQPYSGAAPKELPTGMEIVPYKGVTPDRATEIATNAIQPIEVAIDNGVVILRDGRHRLAAAKNAGATHIASNIRIYNEAGKAEQVGIMALPIGNNAGKDSVGQGIKAVLIPRNHNSRELESIQQAIAEDLQGISSNSGWLRKIDQSFRQVRDKFDPLPGVTPTEAFLDDGTKLTGLSALQRKHHEAFEKLQEVTKSTGSNSKQAIMNKVKAFGTNKVVDQNLLDEAKKLGLEDQLFEVAATRVTPNLRAIAGLETSRGLITGAKDAALLRAIPYLETFGGVQRNPFIQNPNTPSGRIQKYLFEDSAKNLMNLSGGRAGRFGNEVYDETSE